MSHINGLSYDAQLRWLEQQVLEARASGATITLHTLLSITQSVKDARNHNLNCARLKVVA